MRAIKRKDVQDAEKKSGILCGGGIGAAAQKLLVAQPSLSRTINAMEKQMDCQLLERTARGVVPTATGRQLYYYARSILDKFQMLERLYHGGEEQLVSRLHV